MISKNIYNIKKACDIFFYKYRGCIIKDGFLVIGITPICHSLSAIKHLYIRYDIAREKTFSADTFSCYLRLLTVLSDSYLGGEEDTIVNHIKGFISKAIKEEVEMILEDDFITILRMGDIVNTKKLRLSKGGVMLDIRSNIPQRLELYIKRIMAG